MRLKCGKHTSDEERIQDDDEYANAVIPNKRSNATRLSYRQVDKRPLLRKWQPNKPNQFIRKLAFDELFV